MNSCSVVYSMSPHNNPVWPSECWSQTSNSGQSSPCKGRMQVDGFTTEMPEEVTGEQKPSKGPWSSHPMASVAVKRTKPKKTIQHPEPNPVCRINHATKAHTPAQLLMQTRDVGTFCHHPEMSIQAEQGCRWKRKTN